MFLLQESERGSRIDLPKGVQAKKTEKGILLYLKKEEEPITKASSMPFTENGFQGGMYEVILSDSPINSEKRVGNVLRIDRDCIPNSAVFRFRQEGDFIQRFGGGTKSLKKFFNEEKVDTDLREYVPLVADGSEIYAVCGIEISEKLKVTEKTKNILYITVKNYGNTNERH